VAWPLELHLPRALVLAETLEARVAQQVVGGPGGECHLRHQARIDPAGPLLIGARHRDEGQCVALDLAKALGELAASGQGEARAALPEKISFPA
jgi:hypothetical protein